MEMATGQVLYARHPDRLCPPASLTKIMTAILLIENSFPEEIVTASERAVQAPSSSMHLQVGEQIKVRDLLYAILLRSANDGSIAAAEHVAGSVERFVELMNRKAKELGATHTHFVNPHGLHDPRHYSTARDLALITRYALRNPLFNEIVKTSSYSIERSLNQQDLLMVTHAKFLQQYAGADGVKTGYTRQAGFCFIGSATRKGRRLIAVVLNSPKREKDTIRLMEYGFNGWTPLQFGKAGQTVQSVLVEDGLEPAVPAALETDALWVVPRHQADKYRWEVQVQRLRAPVEIGQQVGQVLLKRGRQTVLRISLVATRSIEARRVPLWRWGLIPILTGFGVYLVYRRRRDGLSRGF